MSVLKGACVIGQSGGPTAVINSSAAGAILTALDSESITKVLAAEHGITGVLSDRLFDCSQEDRRELELLRCTPAAALGSCRHKIRDPEQDDSDCRRILEVFKKHDVRYFFYIGGNDSMDTCEKISRYTRQVGYECRVMGIPKTVDNDLIGTDHCPGFGSAARYIATSMAEISCDNQAYGSGSVAVCEIMGRNAGWLAASSALAGINGNGPDLIFLPENPFDIDSFIEDVVKISERKKSVVVAVSEGVRDSSGRFISEYGSDLAKQKDSFGHAQLGGLASTLAAYVRKNTGIKTRGIEFSLLQRSAAHCVSGTDEEEAFMVGENAVINAVEGVSGYMTALKRLPGEEYHSEIELLPLSAVANREKPVPSEYMNKEKNGVSDAYIRYALPLVQGAPECETENGLLRFARLKKVFVK